eukprot:1101456-Amphidinium_carterae.1
MSEVWYQQRLQTFQNLAEYWQEAGTHCGAYKSGQITGTSCISDFKTVRKIPQASHATTPPL